MSTAVKDPKVKRARRVLAAVVELTAAIAEDWDVEYANFREGRLAEDPNAFLNLSVMRDKMVHLGGDAEPLLQLLSMVSPQDKKFVEAQYKKLIKARDIVKAHDEHYRAEAEKVQEAQTQAEAN